MGIVGNSDVDFGHERVMEVPDSVLWSRSRAGDKDAFGVLFERHATAIYNYCFRRIGDWSGAEDLLSVVFLEAWRRRDKELAPDKVLPWLYGIATNVIRNRRRSERRFAAALRRMPQPDSQPNFGELADARIDDVHQMERVLALVERLPTHELDAFALCAWSELSYEDAGLALGVPIGTVRSRLSRARARLRELDPTFGHEEGGSRSAEEALKP